jgi:CRP-like cAMP-binding protein
MRLSMGKYNEFIAGLPLHERNLIKPHLRYFELVRGAYLQREGIATDRVVFPVSGAISLTTSIGGVAVQGAIIGSESLVGAWSGGENLASPYDAVIHIPGAGMEIPLTIFHELMESSPVLRSRVAYANSIELSRLVKTTACTAMHSTENRICRWLLELHDRSSNGHLPITQEELAGMLGIRRTTVTLIASKLQARGALEWRRGRVFVRNRQIIEAIACECYSGVPETSDCSLDTVAMGWELGSTFRVLHDVMPSIRTDEK